MKIRVVLSIGGWDPTAGAGVLLDCQVFSVLGIQAKFVLSAITVQSPFEVIKFEVLPSALIREQVEGLVPHYEVEVVNIGLFQPGLIGYIKQRFPRSRLILDPVMESGSGGFRFHEGGNISEFRRQIRDVYLITPNIGEAERLGQCKIGNPSDMEHCARKLQRDTGVTNVLITGGDLKPAPLDMLRLEGRTVRYPSASTEFRIHGTGSFLNAGIAAGLFRGWGLARALEYAKGLLLRSAQNVDPGDPLLKLDSEGHS